MTDQIIELNNVIKRYKGIITDLEKQIKEAKEKMDIAYKALKLLDEEKQATQKKLFTSEAIVTETLSEKYREASMKDAITDIFYSHLSEPLTGQQIYDELKKNGYISKSKNLLRDVYVFLNKAYKAERIISITEGKPKKYKLPPIKPRTENVDMEITQ